MGRTIAVNGYEYDLPLGREVAFAMPDEDMVAIAVDGFRRLRGGAASAPSADSMAGKIMADTGVNFGAAMLVTMAEPIDVLPPRAA